MTTRLITCVTFAIICFFLIPSEAMKQELSDEKIFYDLVNQIPFGMEKSLSPRRNSLDNLKHSQTTIEKNNWDAFKKTQEAIKNFDHIPTNWSTNPMMYILQKYYEAKKSIDYKECWGDDKISRLITSFPNLDVNIRNAAGHTPLYIAVMTGNGLLIKVLLERKCDLNIQTEDEQWSPLHEICYKGNIEILKAFCNSEQKINPNIKNNMGRTPLHYLVGVAPHQRPSLFPMLNYQQASHFDILAYKNNQDTRLQMLKLLAEHGVDVTAEDKNGHSPLQFAQTYDHKAFILEMGKLIK